MKLNKLFIGAIAALASAAMVACSDDAPDTPGVDVPKDGGYIAVNIVAPSGTSSRTATEGDFEYGEDNEKAIDNATFFLFDKDGNLYGDPLFCDKTQIQPTDKSENPNGNIERVANVLLVINRLSGTAEVPAKFITVLNLAPAKTTLFSADAIKSRLNISDLTYNTLRTAINDFATTGVENTFVMSNSVYLDGTTEACATTIENLYSSSEEALIPTNAVEVYVERIVAKVRIHKDENDITTTEATGDVDPSNGTTKITLYPEIQGIAVTNTFNYSYLFKDITNNTNWFTNWNDKDNFRSYWANSVTTLPSFATDGATLYTKLSYNQIKEDGYQITDATAKNIYVQENTTSAIKTAVIAVVQFKDGTGADAKPVSFVKWGTTYCEVSKYPVLITDYLNNLGYQAIDRSSPDGRPFEASDLLIYTKTGQEDDEVIYGVNSDLNPWQACCQLKETVTNVINKDGVTIQDFNNSILSQPTLRARFWNNGMAYYYVPIEHFGTEDQAYGVVRNHIYDINVKSIKGLGIPVTDPNEPIDPTNPDDKEPFYYLGARINILSWKVVQQDVDFGPKN